MFTPKPLEVTLLNATSGTGTAVLVINYVYKTVVIKVSGVGTISGQLQVSNDNVYWVSVKTFTGDDYYETTNSFKYIRAKIITAGGKVAKVDLSANK